VGIDSISEGIDILEGGIGAEADTEGAGGDFFIKVHSGEDVANFSAMAGGASGDEDIMGTKLADDILARIPWEGGGEDMRGVMGGDNEQAWDTL